MGKIKLQELIQDRLALEEIEKHKWLESEKAGRDIGFDAAAQDWVNRFGDIWAEFNLSKKNSTKKKATAARKAAPKKPAAEKGTGTTKKTTSAKSPASRASRSIKKKPVAKKTTSTRARKK